MVNALHSKFIETWLMLVNDVRRFKREHQREIYRSKLIEKPIKPIMPRWPLLWLQREE
jgi:hypothetical protein